MLSTATADALDTYVVRHLGTLLAFSSMLPAILAGDAAAAASASAAAAAMDSTEYAVTCLHLLVNVGLSVRDLFVSFRRFHTSAGLAERLLAVTDGFSGPVLLPPTR